MTRPWWRNCRACHFCRGNLDPTGNLAIAPENSTDPEIAAARATLALAAKSARWAMTQMPLEALAADPNNHGPLILRLSWGR